MCRSIRFCWTVEQGLPLAEIVSGSLADTFTALLVSSLSGFCLCTRDLEFSAVHDTGQFRRAEVPLLHCCTEMRNAHLAECSLQLGHIIPASCPLLYLCPSGRKLNSCVSKFQLSMFYWLMPMWFFRIDGWVGLSAVWKSVGVLFFFSDILRISVLKAIWNLKLFTSL